MNSTIARFLIFVFAALPATAQAGQTLNIAVTNDDGWKAPGIQVMHRTLKAAGHQATLVAPADQQSGSSASLNTGQTVLRREAEDQFSVHACLDQECKARTGAEPASCALIAIDIAQRRSGGTPPDLLISGINDGPNLGGVTQSSGTVGATASALTRSMNGAVTAIAVSTSEPAGCSEEPACIEEHYAQVSDFIVNLLALLAERRTEPGSPLLPDGMGLNINYPPVQPTGLRVVAQDAAILTERGPSRVNAGCSLCLDIGIGNEAPGEILGIVPDTLVSPEGEIAGFLSGQITIVPIRIDYTASDHAQLKGLFEGLLEP